METGIHADALGRDGKTIHLLCEYRKELEVSVETAWIGGYASLLTPRNERLFESICHSRLPKTEFHGHKNR